MFKNRMHQQRVPFVIYADIECFTSMVDTCMPNPHTSYTHTSRIHEPSGFCYRVVCDHSKYSMDAVLYRGQKVVETFIDRLRKSEKQITTILDNPVPMNLTQDEEASFLSKQACYVCHHPLGTDRVRDHDHLTGMTIYSV